MTDQVTNHLAVVGAADPAGDQLERLLLHGAHALDERLLRHVLAVTRDRAAHVLTHHLVDVQHVEVDTAELQTRVQRAANTSHSHRAANTCTQSCKHMYTEH